MKNLVINPTPHLPVSGEQRRMDFVCVISCLTVLVTAFALGGTSGEPPVRVLIIELVAALSIVVTLFTWRAPVPAIEHLAALAILFLVPLLQLMPLPPALWAVLPGRDTAVQVSQLIGPLSWRPLSLDPEATFKSLLSLLLPAATFLAMLRASARELEIVLLGIVCLGIASILLGMLQILGGSAFYLFDTAHRGLPLGFFGNRNHQAAFLYICAILVTQGLAARSPYRLWSAGLILLFAAGIIATSSRSGMVLLALGLLTVSLQHLRPQTRRFSGVAIIMAIPLATASFFSSGVLQRSIARFSEIGADYRYQFWPDILVAAKAYFPVGAGLGSFVKSYQAFESLNIITGLYVNRAHNEYLQLLLEAGLIGVIAPVAFVVWIGVCIWRLRAPVQHGSVQKGKTAAIAVGLLLLHSLIDYPLRTYALMALFGILCGLIARPSEKSQFGPR